MMDNRTPYDKSATIWSPDGELVQLSYARRASQKGLPGFGLILGEKQILLAALLKKDKLINTPRKIKLIDDNLYMVASGLSSDSNILLVQARYIAQNHRLIYGEQMGPEKLTKQLGDILAQQTIGMGSRALGVSLLIAGFLSHEKRPRLYYIDTGGSFFAAKAYATGQDSDRIVNFFRKHYKGEHSLEGAKKLIVDALNEGKADVDSQISEDDVEFVLLEAE